MNQPTEFPVQDQVRKYQRLCAEMRAEFLRFDLGKRQKILVEVLLELSFGWGTPAVIIPTWEVLADLTGLSAANIHTSITELREMRIVSLNKAGPGLEFKLQPNSESWQCRPRQSRAAIAEAIDCVRRFNQRPEEQGAGSGEQGGVLPADFVFPALKQGAGSTEQA